MPFFIKSLSIILLLLSSFQLKAQVVLPDQIVLDYSCENKALKQALFDLSKQTGVNIAWQGQLISDEAFVSIQARSQKLGKVLHNILSPHGIKYKIVGSQISLVKDKLKFLDDKFTISGFIRDARSSEALFDAHIFTYDRQKVSFSNEHGFYSFTLPKGI